MENQPNLSIEAGKRYIVGYAGTSFQIVAIRPSAVKGWWFCRTADTLEDAVFPAAAFIREVSSEERPPIFSPQFSA